MLKKWMARRLLPACLSALVFMAGAAAQEAPLRGEQDAPVTILLFSAFTCPYCAAASKTLAQLQAKFPGKINLVFKHFPLGLDGPAYLTHRAALAAAEQGKFWEMHDALFNAQAALGEAQKIEALARQLKLDMPRFNAALAQPAGDGRIKADLAEANALKVNATPTFYIDGYKFEGAQQASVLELMVEHKLARHDSEETPSLQTKIDAARERDYAEPLQRLFKNTTKATR